MHRTLCEGRSRAVKSGAPRRIAAGMFAALAGLCGCQSTGADGASSAGGGPGAREGLPAATLVAIPAAGESARVGGDADARVEAKNGVYRWGTSQIDTPLPEGYPAPTPPGAIEIKTYPSVRLAEVERTTPVDRTMNGAFWPLFNHIKKHDIAMTSPVEMNYRGLDGPGDKPESWSMAFLYRSASLNQPGREGEVRVRDQEGVTVLAVGLRGNYSMSLVERGMERLESWLGENPEWEACGDWRSLYYNGPMLFSWRKWAEVQIPVRRRGS